MLCGDDSLSCEDQVYIRQRVTNNVCGFFDYCSLIICSNSNWEVTPSILKPLYVVMSLFYQSLGFALKSPRMTVRKGLYESWFNSKLLLINDLKSSWDWLDEWYNPMNYIACL